MNFEPDIIETIESVASDFLKRNKKLPTVVTLSKEEFKAYEEELRNGRHPKIKHKGKEVLLSVGRFS